VRQGGGRRRALSGQPAGASHAALRTGTRRASNPGRATNVARAGGFLYRRCRFTPLGRIPGAGPMQIHYAISDRGEIAGSYVDEGARLGADGAYPPDATHAFVEDSRGDVTRFDVPARGSSFPQGINDQGQIAGISLDANEVQTGFVRDPDGSLTSIALSAIGTKARDVNDRGQVVGVHAEPAANELGYVVRGYLRDRRGRSLARDEARPPRLAPDHRPGHQRPRGDRDPGAGHQARAAGDGRAGRLMRPPRGAVSVPRSPAGPGRERRRRPRAGAGGR
jgi:hypothetical protein